MKPKLMLSSLLLPVVFLAMAPSALASSTWNADGVNGSDSNDCKSAQTSCKTIGHVISLAASGDSIMVAAATYTENLVISRSLKVIGSGASTTVIDGGGVNTVVTISNTGAHVTLSKVTIRNGTAIRGGGIVNNGTLTMNISTVSGNRATDSGCNSGCLSSGGGISNGGTLMINQGTISNNVAFNSACKHQCSYGGGGVSNSGTLTINNSSLSGNGTFHTGCFDHCIAGGGGIGNGGTLTINRSILVGNWAVSSGCNTNCYGLNGGGISGGSTMTINNSTLSGNSALNGGGAISTHGTTTINNSTVSGNSTLSGVGGGIYNTSGYTATLQNNIVANNSGNCWGSMISNGYNVSSDGTCNFVGTGDLNNTDPMLGALQNNGGPTQTMLLLPGSPAIDAGNPGGCTDGNGNLLKTDQRGKPRHDTEDTGGCDIGAYERQFD